MHAITISEIRSHEFEREQERMCRKLEGGTEREKSCNYIDLKNKNSK